MDRRLPGIIFIALVISTIVTYFAFVEGVEESITVIRNVAPERIRRQVDLELTHKFVFSLVSRRPIERLVLKYSFFVRTDDLIPPSDITIDGWVGSFDQLEIQRQLLGNIGFEIESIQGEIEKNAEKQEYLLFDAGEAYPAFTEWWLAEDAATSHLILPKGKENATHYLGKGGFYYHRGDLAKVMVIRDEKQTTYIAQRSAQELHEGERPIDEAPRNGKIPFDKMQPDETVSVIVELMGRADIRRLAVSMIRIYVDGKLEEVVVNFIG